ncbi:MAG: DUF4242 domain-containing protein [Leptolyngbya sp. DLM2.Bin15]|nr:MAG: DUF4242 domain-containing protein [Leptolyngbya sp. DLM2.Bin15]
MAIIIVETLSDTPLTPDEPTDVDFRILNCLQERNGTWRYSLLSRDRHRMLCTFDSPDAESVRESYRKAGGFFNRIWTGEHLSPVEPLANRQMNALMIVESFSSSGFSDPWWHKLLSSYVEQETDWIQSYRSLDQSRLVCELNTANSEAIANAYDQLAFPYDRIWPAILIQP